MKYRIVCDHHTLIAFEEWSAAIVCFYNKITSHFNEVIEFYEHETVMLTWVKGKGLIHKKARSSKKEPSERPLSMHL